MSAHHNHQHSSHGEHDHDGHHHSDHHGHHHGTPDNIGRAFIIAIILNSAFVVIEFGYGFIANSTALMADAGHNLSDVLGLVLAWGASILARKAPSDRYTFGLRSSSILAALANAILLLVACGAIALEAVMRFSQPPAVAGLTVSVVAAVGIVINGVSAWLFMRGSKTDLNIRGAYLHMLADAAISLGVAITGVAILFTQWNWLDPMVSLAIVAVIIIGTWSLLRESLKLSLHAVPAHIDVGKVAHYLHQCAGVTQVNDLHIWGMSTTEAALTVHLTMPAGVPNDAYLDDISQRLRERFNIQHSTLQVQQGAIQHQCALHPRT